MKKSNQPGALIKRFIEHQQTLNNQSASTQVYHHFPLKNVSFNNYLNSHSDQHLLSASRKTNYKDILNQQMQMKGQTNQITQKSRIADIQNQKNVWKKYPFGLQNAVIKEDVIDRYKANNYIFQGNVLDKFKQQAQQFRRNRFNKPKKDQQTVRNNNYLNNYIGSTQPMRNRRVENDDNYLPKLQFGTKSAINNISMQQPVVIDNNRIHYQFNQKGGFQQQNIETDHKRVKKVKRRKNKKFQEKQNQNLDKLGRMLKQLEQSLAKNTKNIERNVTKVRTQLSENYDNTKKKYTPKSYIIQRKQGRKSITSSKFYQKQTSRIPLVVYNNVLDERIFLQKPDVSMNRVYRSEMPQNSGEMKKILNIIRMNDCRIKRLVSP